MKFSLPVLCLLTTLPTTFAQTAAPSQAHVLNDANQIQELRRALKQAATATGNGINYHGGPVMSQTVTIYYVWYGNWNGNSGVTLLETFAKNLGGTPYYNINTTYTDATGGVVRNNLIFGGSTVDNYSLGKSLTDAQIWQAVSSAITSGKFPADPNAVYFLLTSADVNATSGFCTQYCGWHTYNTLNNVPIKYSFVGDAGRCPSACTAQPNNSPNGNPGADGMASVLAHELSETVTDPQLNAWWDSSGEENGDKCAWTFGVTAAASNGTRYNFTAGNTNYLIQQNWVNAGGGSCTMQYVMPVIADMSPRVGSSGSSVPVTVTGTNFAAGANFAISGTGVTTSNLVVVSPTKITATLNIATTADLGPHNVSVTQGPAVSAPVTFTVNPAGFSFTQVAPTSGAAGASVPVTLTGTNFATGATVSVSATGVTVNNVRVVSPTQITASLSLPSNLPAGPYSVTVTQGGKPSAPLTFNVTSTALTLTGLTPASLPAGGTARITLVGTNFVTGVNVNVAGAGVTVSGVTVVSATQLTASFAVAANAAVGIRNITLSGAGTSATAAVPFTITAAPALTAISPASGAAGSTTKITLTGTNIVADTRVLVGGAAGVAVTGVSIVSPTQATANLVVDRGAAAGGRPISLAYGSATSAALTFTILGPPTLTQLAPATAASGTTTKVTFTGTNFQPGSTVAASGAGISLASVVVVSATQITANVVIEPTAAAGPRNFTVTTGTAVTAPIVFTISGAPLTLTSIAPATATAGSTVNVTLTGNRFSTGNTMVISGSGVTLSGITIVSATQMTAQFAISGTASAGPRNVTVSNGTSSTNAVVFTVAAAVSQAPTLTRLDKTSASAGSTFNLTATGTNFTANSRLNFSGAGITVSNVQVVSPTQMTAAVAVASTAATGSRSVTVSSSTAATTLALPFTVTDAMTMSPSSGVLGNALNATISGSGFTPNATVVSNDPAIPVLQTTYVSPTQLSVAIGLGGTVGTHYLMVGGTPVLFTITAPPPPTTSSITPNSGALGKTVTVTIQGANFTPNMRVTVSGSGVSAGNMTSAGATSVTFPLVISSAAGLGERTITISTPSGVSSPVTFRVTP